MAIRNPFLRRVLRALDWLTPTVQELWTFLLIGLNPWLCLSAFRVWLLTDLEKVEWVQDSVYVQLAEAELWGAYCFFWLYIGRLVPRTARVLGHLIGLPFLLASALDLIFYHVTGGRADLDSVEYLLAELVNVWPVIASEVRAWHIAALAALVAFALGPLGWTPLRTDRTWWSRAAILALYPFILVNVYGRLATSKEVRPLQKTFTVAVVREAINRRDDVILEPTPADVAPVRAGAPTRPHNVVVVFMESVAAKHTTLHDPAVKTTPNLVRLAAEGLSVPQMYAVIPHTTKALVTTLCGDWPDPVGNANEAKPGGLPGACLSGLLSEHGYRTAFFQPARADFEDRTDLTHHMGYDTFRPRAALRPSEWEENSYFGIDDRSMLGPGLAWSAEEPGRPFLATYLTLASHHDYKLPTHWQLLDFPDITGRLEKYQNAVRYVDDFVGRLVRGYQEAGLADDTLFVIIGDHGEGFGEHGRYQHDLTIHDEGLQVPAVLWGPGVLGGRTGAIDGLRQQIDVLPTVLEVLGMPLSGAPTRGASLLAAAPAERTLYHSCWRSHRCIARRDTRGKFIDHYGDRAEQWFLPGDLTEEEPAPISDADLAVARADVRRWFGHVRGRMAERRKVWLETVQAPDDAPAQTQWGDLALLGCTLDDTEAVPGEAVWVTCRWRADAQLRQNWSLSLVFDGVVDAEPEVWVPFRGVFRMWDWRVGWRVTDQMRAFVPSDTEPGPIKLSMSVVRSNGAVVPTRDGALAVELGEVTVLPRFRNVGGIEGVRLRDVPTPDPSYDLPALVLPEE